jgi:hypothetical protein
MPSVASVQVQDSSAVSTTIIAAGPSSVTKKRNAKQALLPQCDIDRSDSSRRPHKGKS